MTKTNKSFKKRLKVTKTGKVLRRRSGQNHFRAKKSRKSDLDKKRWKGFDMKRKTLAKNLPHNNVQIL